MATKKKNPWSWETSEEERYEAQQAFLNATSAESLQQQVADARTQVESYAGEDFQTPKWSERRISMKNYHDSLQRYQTYLQLSGNIDQTQQSNLDQMYEQYSQSWNNLQEKAQANYFARQIPGLSEQAEQIGSFQGRKMTPERLAGMMGLVDRDGNLTEAGQEYWQKNTYKQGASEAGQKAARWSEEAKTYTTELEQANYWLGQIETAEEDSEELALAAREMGITTWTNREDLMQQIQAKADRAERMGATPQRLADTYTQQQMGYEGALYQMVNGEDTLGSAYYRGKMEEEEAIALDYARDGNIWGAAYSNLIGDAARARSNYMNQQYQEQVQEDMAVIQASPVSSQRLELARNSAGQLRSLEALYTTAQQDLQYDQGMTPTLAAELRTKAEAYGFVLPEDDQQIGTWLEQQIALAQADYEGSMRLLEEEGYDRERLEYVIDQELNAEEMSVITAEARQTAQDSPGAASTGSSLVNLFSGAGYISSAPRAISNTWAGVTGNYDAYRPIDTNTGWYQPTQYVMAVRDEVMQNIEDEGGNAFWYSTGMSMLDNITQMAVGAMTFGGSAMASAAGKGAGAVLQAGVQAASPVTLATMGLGAASQELVTLTNAGVPSDQAFTLATIAGGIEIVTEKIGIDNLVTNLGRRQASQMLRSMTQQMVAEGGEEMLAEVGNLAADYLIRMEDSDVMEAIEYAKAMGMTESEAIRAVLLQHLSQTLEAGAAGALSGLGFGGGAVATNALSNTTTARGQQVLAQGTVPQLLQQADFYGVDAGGISENSTARQIGTVHRQVEQAAQAAEGTLRNWAADHKYNKNGTDALLHAYTEYSSTGAGKMSAQEFAISFDTAYQHGASDAKFGAEGSYLARAAEDALTEGLTQSAVKYAYTAGLASVKSSFRAKAQAAVQTITQREKPAQVKTAPLAEGIMQVEQISETDAVIVMPDGTRQNITTMDTQGTAAEIVSQAMEDGYSAVVVNQMLKSYDGEMAPDRYYEQYRSAMIAGMEGETLAQVKKQAPDLPAAVAKEARDRGRLLGKAYDLADRIGSAGEMALEQYGYAAPAEFEKFYKAGLEGKNFRQAERELGKVSDQIKDEMQAAVRAGLRDNKGGFKYGEQNHGNGQERQADVDPGQRSGRVAEGAVDESGRARPAQGRAAGEAAGKNTGTAEKVSARDLGLEDGTDRASARVIQADRLTEEQRAKVQEYADAGAELVLIEGYLEIQAEAGTTIARGAQFGDRIIASVSDPGATWEQIARHEAKHRYFRQHPDALQQEWDLYTSHLSAEEINRWLAAYAEQYAALSDEITVEYLMEEALCDWAADIDYTEASPAGYEALDEIIAHGLDNAKEAAQRYSIEPDFESYIDLWNREKKPDGWTFIVGTTSNVIQGLGAMEQDIYMLSDKIKEIFKDHPEMTLDEIKKIPEILEDPVLVLASRNVSNKGQKRSTNNTRVVVLGDVKATNNLPVMDTLDLRPFENRILVEGFQKVSSAYTKDNELEKRIYFFEHSDVLYADKKRTAKLLETIGFSMPIELQLSGYTGSISYFRQDVNIQGTPFKKVFKYSIAGRKAATANMDALDEARDLEVNGYTPGEIYRETGWFRGADGQWRFEIDDSTMRYYKGGDAKFRKMHPGYVRHQELTTKMLDGTITEEEYQELRNSIWHREYGRLKERVDRGNAHLDDILDHDALFEAYPQLRDVKIEFAPLQPGVMGFFRRRDNKIYLSEALQRAPEDTLVHEIQHAIQALEGFANGSSTAYWERIVENGGKIDSMYLRNATAAVMQFEANPANAAVVEARNRLNEIWDTEGVRAGNAYYAQLEAEGMAAKVDAYEDLLWEQSSASVWYAAPSELYENTAGEQEARDTASRRNMTAEQRRQQMPQTGTKDTVFAEGSMAAYAEEGQKNTAREGGRYSIQESPKGRYVQADRQVLTGDDPSRWGKQIEAYINEKIRNHEDVLFPTEDGHLLALTGRSAYKLTDRHKSQIEKKGRELLDDESFGLKLRAAAHIDELIQVGRFDGYEEDTEGNHENDIGEDGFNYYLAWFKDFDGTYYRVPFSAGLNESEETIYSIGKIRKRKSTARRGSSSGTKAGGAQVRRDRLSSGGIVAQSGNDVKGKSAIAEAFEAAQRKKDKLSVIDLNDTEQQLKDANKRIKQLEGINQHLREQMKLTPDYTPDARQIRKAAKLLMAEYGGSWSQQEMEAKLANLWKSEQLRGKGELSFEKLMDQTRRVASELVRNYLDRDNQDLETLRDIKQYVRSTRIYLSPDLRADLDHYGGYAAVRKANFGKLRLANSGTGVDQIYMELHEQWPAYFPEEIWNPADQLMQIIDVINDGTQVLQRSPLDGMPDAMDYMTNKILWELGLVNPAPKTKADELLDAAAKVSNRDHLMQAAAAHEQEQMDQLEAFYKQKLQQVKNDREDKIQKIKDGYRQKAQEQRDWKAEQEVKRKLLYHAGKLKRMSRKVGPEQQKQILEIFGDINTMCQRMTGYTIVKDYVQGMSTDEIRPEGYRDLSDPSRIMDTEEGAMLPEYRGDKMVDLDNLKKWYDGQKKNNPDFIPDKRIEEILESWEAKQINTMTVQEAQALLDVALNIENEIRTQKQLIDAQDRREVYRQVQDIVDNVNSTKGKYDNLLSRGLTGWMTENTLSPVRMIQRLTGYHDNDPMYQATIALQQGEMKMLDYQRRAYDLFKPFTEDRKFMDYLAGKGKQAPITIGGMDERGNIVEVKITPDMRVALYLHSLNYQNLRHIQRGGLTIPHYESYVKGKTEEAYDRATRLRLTPSQVKQITGHMTERELAYAKRLEKYFNVMSKTEINETSVKLKGYEIAKTNHYYPIETNKEFVVKEFDSLKFDGSLENMGFTKERIEGGNPIMLGNASTTLARSVKQHSMYTGLAIPLRNFNKLRGVSIVKSDAAGAVKYQADSLMDTLRRKWGKSGLDYIEKMVADLSGVKPQQERGMEVLNKLRSNYAGAVLELNPSTAMKQLIAYPSAASVLGWDAMAVGLNKWQRVNIDEINKYTPLLWHRMQGYIDSDLGDYVANKKHKPRGLNWNQAVDVAVVKRIWKAAEWKVAHDDRTLVQDREAWMKATAALFNQVMLQSQANYTTMQRGQILRTDNIFLRSIAMFKTEPFQSFNVLYDALQNEAAKRRQLQAAREEAAADNAEAHEARIRELEQAHKAAKQRIAQAVPAVLTSNLLEALITFAWAFFRGKQDDWEDDETGEITAASFFKRLGMRTLGNLGGIVPFGAELAELITAVVMGDQYYGIENMETSVIADAMTNFYTLANTVKGWLEKPEDGEDKQMEAYDIVLELLDQGLKLGALLGLPTENVAKTLKGITRWALIAAMGEAEGEYWYRRFTSQTTGSGHSKEDLDALYQVAAEGDMEAYRRLYDSILRYKDEESVQNGLTSRIQAATRAGEIDVDTAMDLLGLATGETDPNELFWKVQGWQYMEQTGEDSFSRYDLVYDAMYDGTGFDAAYQQLLEHGVSEEDARSAIRGQIRDWYQGKSSDELTISEEDALLMLQEYGGKSAEDAQAQVLEWSCLVDTGIAYGDIKQSVLDGVITESQASDMLQRYGGKNAEEAAETAAAYGFMRDHPELAEEYEPSFVNKVAGKYAVYGSGINVNVYADFVEFAENTSADQDENGNWISGTRKPKIVDYIAAIPGLTPEQRDNLMLTDYSTYNLDDMPW